MAKAKKLELTVNERVLKNVTSAINATALNWFEQFTNSWPDKAGPLPTPEMLMVGAVYSTRGAGCESGFVSLQLRETGCSIFELGQAFNCGPANNHSRDLMRAGYFERSSKPYKLVFTPKGEADLYRRLGLDAQGKPVKAAKPVKVKRAANKKPAPVDAPAVDVAEPVTEPQGDTSLPATPEAIADLAAHFNS